MDNTKGQNSIERREGISKIKRIKKTFTRHVPFFRGILSGKPKVSDAANIHLQKTNTNHNPNTPTPQNSAHTPRRSPKSDQHAPTSSQKPVSKSTTPKNTLARITTTQYLETTQTPVTIKRRLNSSQTSSEKGQRVASKSNTPIKIGNEKSPAQISTTEYRTPTNESLIIRKRGKSKPDTFPSILPAGSLVNQVSGSEGSITSHSSHNSLLQSEDELSLSSQDLNQDEDHEQDVRHQDLTNQPSLPAGHHSTNLSDKNQTIQILPVASKEEGTREQDPEHQDKPSDVLPENNHLIKISNIPNSTIQILPATSEGDAARAQNTEHQDPINNDSLEKYLSVNTSGESGNDQTARTISGSSEETENSAHFSLQLYENARFRSWTLKIFMGVIISAFVIFLFTIFLNPANLPIFIAAGIAVALALCLACRPPSEKEQPRFWPRFFGENKTNPANNLNPNLNEEKNTALLVIG